jgi:hypothetical protein
MAPPRSGSSHRYAYPVARFRRREIPKPVDYPARSIHATDYPPTSAGNGFHAALHSTLRGAVTRLSYPRAQAFARCRVGQISPPTPVSSRTPCQPPCAASVTLFRQVPPAPLSKRIRRQPGCAGHCLPASVPWSPNLGLSAQIGSKGTLLCPAPIAAAPARLGARGCSGNPGSVGSRTGLAMEWRFGWQPT